MAFLLDTNVPSELVKPAPDRNVVAWIDSHPGASLHLSVITLGELRQGAELLPLSHKRLALERKFQQDLILFHGRLLPVTQAIGEVWGSFSAQRRLAGRPLAPSDGLIAATAFLHNLTLVTRNVKDFSGLGLMLLNPWDD